MVIVTIAHLLGYGLQKLGWLNSRLGNRGYMVSLIHLSHQLTLKI